jgi:hypothetical protein
VSDARESPDVIDRVAALITRVQASPNRTPTQCALCEVPLVVLVTDDLWRGKELFLHCPECEDARDPTPKEIMAFRVFGLLLDAQEQAMK